MTTPPTAARPLVLLRAPLARVILTVGLLACTGRGGTERTAVAPPADGRQFTLLPASYTGVEFENRIRDDGDVNVFTYRNFYNGGGVAIGDLNGDGRPDAVLTSNQDGPRLYVNDGKFRFRDETKAAGVRTRMPSWTNGVTLADVNGDGRLDIYLCKAGPGAPNTRANELWINQGNDRDSVPTFTEMAVAYGVADLGYSTQAVFLDYDHDGDLDLLVVNNSPRPASSFGTRNTRNVRDAYGGEKLFRNDPGSSPGQAPSPNGSGRHFVDVSASAGIHSPEIAFGLGVVVSDVNRDGWPDIYVSNDFFERDYLYINNHDGTFAEHLDQDMPVLSYFSMGLDIADIDNDGWPDIYTTDMLPEDDRRLKLTTMFEGWDVYQAKVRNGYHHQSMRNMLQRNNHDGTFSDVGQMAGVARTDWSWGALIADFDLDGQKDIYVTNGIAKDITSQDYVAFLANQETMRDVTNGGREKVDFRALTKAMDSTPLAHYLFHNDGGPGSGPGQGLQFTNVAAAWGLATPSFASGAAYGDLDGDGAPDLIVNNVDGPAFIYRNNARALGRNHFLQVRLDGEGLNRFALGARVTLHNGDAQQMQELAPTRGFESSVDYTLTFGLGARDRVDSVTVEWPDGRLSVERQVAADRKLVVRHAAAIAAPPSAGAAAVPTLLADVTAQVGLGFVHHENDFIDFDRERLIPKLVSTEGPTVAVGDVNGDGLDDMYIGGAKDQAGELLIQQSDGRFAPSGAGVFAQDASSEDVGAVFFDANGDGRPDLYVVSGGSEYSDFASALQDRLYINDGQGRFHKAINSLPVEAVSGSRVVAADYDGDGAMDLFVGGRVVPWKYGMPPQSMLLHNDGRGHFTDVTEQRAPELAHVGMVTDAAWRDVDGDGRVDLVVVGEWMSITVFHNAGGGRLVRTHIPGLDQSHGWWNRIIAGDFTGDGRVDFIVGNLGLNSRLRATTAEPTTMFVKDFDKNGLYEQIIACYSQGVSYPLVLRDDLLRALPSLKARYLHFSSYAGQRVTDIFPPNELASAVVDTAETFASVLARNNGDGSFTMVPLPREAQQAPVYGLLAQDVDHDGRMDLLLAGNFDGMRPEYGRMAASYGLVLHADSAGAFTPLPRARSGFFVPGQTRDIQRLRTRNGALYIVARNNDRPLLFRDNPQATRGSAVAVGRR